MDKIPKEVLNVVRGAIQGDPNEIRHHHYMSVKGGQKAAEVRASKAALDALNLAERTAELERTETITPEGDVLPPPPINASVH